MSGSRQMRHIGCEPLLLRLRRTVAPLPSPELRKRFRPRGDLPLPPPLSVPPLDSASGRLPSPRRCPKLATRSPSVGPVA